MFKYNKLLNVKHIILYILPPPSCSNPSLLCSFRSSIHNNSHDSLLSLPYCLLSISNPINSAFLLFNFQNYHTLHSIRYPLVSNWSLKLTLRISPQHLRAPTKPLPVSFPAPRRPNRDSSNLSSQVPKPSQFQLSLMPSTAIKSSHTNYLLLKLNFSASVLLKDLLPFL